MANKNRKLILAQRTKSEPNGTAVEFVFRFADARMIWRVIILKAELTLSEYRRRRKDAKKALEILG